MLSLAFGPFSVLKLPLRYGWDSPEILELRRIFGEAPKCTLHGLFTFNIHILSKLFSNGMRGSRR